MLENFTDNFKEIEAVQFINAASEELKDCKEIVLLAVKEDPV